MGWFVRGGKNGMGCYVRGDKNNMGCYVWGDKNSMGCIVRGGKSFRGVKKKALDVLFRDVLSRDVLFGSQSPAGKGLASWLLFVVSICELITFPLVSWVRCGT